MNLIGALRRAMATTGYTEVKEFQRVEATVLRLQGTLERRAVARRHQSFPKYASAAASVAGSTIASPGRLPCPSSAPIQRISM